MSEWKEYKLKDITSKIGSGSTPTGGKDAYFETGITLIRSLNIYDFVFEYKDLAFINEAQAKKLNGVKLHKDDILLNITGASVGRCTIVPKQLLPARVNQHVSIIRVVKEKVNAKFLLYCINSKVYKDLLLTISGSGATREALTKEDIENFKILLPELPIQNRIASILSAYNDLIENNNRRIALLEQTAEQIYKEWFVRMRFPGYENAEFEKGSPKGWGNIYFRDFIKLNRGFDLPEDKIVEGKYPILASTSIKAYHNEYKVEAPCIVTGRSGSLGTVQYVNKKSWPLNTSLYVKDYKGNSPRFVYYFLRSIKLENFNCGAGVPTLNQNHLHKLKLILPDLKIQKMFDEMIIPIFNEIENLQLQTQTLKQTRDLLLPRLISGKLRVHEVSNSKSLS